MAGVFSARPEVLAHNIETVPSLYPRVRPGADYKRSLGVIAGDISPEHGEVKISPRRRIGRLAQEAPDGSDSLLDVVLKAHGERSALLAEAESAHDPHRIAEIQTRLADIGAHAAQHLHHARAERVHADTANGKFRPRRDRGQNVRTVAQTKQLLSPHFALVDVRPRHDVLRIPYTHLVAEATNRAPPTVSTSRISAWAFRISESAANPEASP